ncbi:MAG: hypothetical protein A3K19_23415 [Lentisphaerae bacterium RIFOXYB12_FULL_65_16]|nr:MAG: hypothetical protein A3K19_23415 [Lentisphaerae bacterium RIFOXYB12_FULL_65_16]
MSACILLPWADARAEDPTPSATVTSDCGGGGGGEVCVEDPDCGDPLPDQEQTRNSWGPSPAIDLGTPPCAPTGPTLVCVGSTGHSYSISGHSDLDTYTPQKRTRSGSYDGDCVWHWGAWSGWANDGSPQQAGDSTDVTAWHTTGGSITSAGVLTAPTAPGTISITATIDDAPASVSPPDVGTRDDSPVTSAALAVTVVAVDHIDIIAGGSTETVSDTTITVLKGAKYSFEAFAAPAGAGWPSGAPVWSGAASGSGAMIDVTFDSAGTETLTAQCCGSDPGKTVMIEVIVPQIDAVLFDNSFDIYDGEEKWLAARTGQSALNDPGCFKQGVSTQLGVKFWHVTKLSFATNVEVKGDVDFFDEGITKGNYPAVTGKLGTSWPSDAITVTSDSATNAKVDYNKNVGISWSYRVPSGTNAWIGAGSSDDLAYYIIWDAPKNGSPNAMTGAESWGAPNFTKKHIADACEWGREGDSPSDVADRVCDALHRPDVPCAESYTIDLIWGIHATNRGECDELALEFCYVMRCLGVGFHLAYANLKPALNLDGGENGSAYCPEHKKFLSKVGVSWWFGKGNNFQGCAYASPATPPAETSCWDPQHNYHGVKYWELGNDKANPADAGTPPRLGILYAYHWKEGFPQDALQQVVVGDNHDGCAKDDLIEYGHGN